MHWKRTPLSTESVNIYSVVKSFYRFCDNHHTMRQLGEETLGNVGSNPLSTRKGFQILRKINADREGCVSYLRRCQTYRINDLQFSLWRSRREKLFPGLKWTNHHEGNEKSSGCERPAADRRCLKLRCSISENIPALWQVWLIYFGIALKFWRLPETCKVSVARMMSTEPINLCIVHIILL